MNKLTLSEIVKNIDCTCDFDGDVEILDVNTDTRTTKSGDLFIALVGEKFDGHDYVGKAVESGAVAVVCSKPVQTSVPVITVPDTEKALQQIAAYYLTTLNIKVVAVTGSNGKTTTRNMITRVLQTKYNVYSTKKNFNNEIGLPKSVLELDGSYDIAVLEMGMNHFGEIRTLTNIAKPDVAVITNIGKAHIGNLGSQENICKAKFEILEGLKSGGLIVLNADDPFLYSADTKEFNKVFIGFDSSKGTALTAENIESSGEGTRFTVVYNGEKTDGYIPLPGKYNVANLLEAVYVGIHFGVDVRAALDSVSDYTPEAMRTDVIVAGGVSVIRDYYNSSPDSARVGLEALKTYNKNGKKFALLGEMLELGEYSAAEHKKLGELCAGYDLDGVFFIGKDYVEFSDGMPEKSICCDSAERDYFLSKIKEFAQSGVLTDGDVVLVKGSRGMKMEEAYEVLMSVLEK
ncbi:MAG: UDP-N-acetylmuramoyl-tripeptide--D-alanyl-D-alanine ligase [Ruminococcaceae bacterium]|nr:UDP-N-acetylmuramoyl-tripeptide--D-alanyl-D-alanine ligase [Oscillospiraceae bacterium]